MSSASVQCVICHERLRISRFCCGQLCARGAFCQHLFHEECIAGWLVIQNSCPICREPFLESSDVTGGWVEKDRCLLCDAALTVSMGDSHGAACDFYGIVGALVEGEPTQSDVIHRRRM